MKSVFIDGQSGTTGQKIHSLLGALNNVSFITLADPKDPKLRQEAMNDSDITVLCLPDEESKNAVSKLHPKNNRTKILDCSSAFRVAQHWTYGFPELSAIQADDIRRAQLVSNPGCYATGAIAALNPLMRTPYQYNYRGESYVGILQPSWFSPTIIGFSGYSGGGKSMIQDFESSAQMPPVTAYSLSVNHKHEAEIQKHAGLLSCALQPVVMPVFKGMMIIIPIDRSQFLNRLDALSIRTILADYYSAIDNGHVSVMPYDPDANAKITPDDLPFDTGKGTLDNKVYLRVYGTPKSDKVSIVSTLDNLGKGAATQALQNLRLMLG
jgi:N-acetyl-gamma-glutamyl-phosphate reductase